MPVPEGRGLVSRSLLRDDAYRALRNAIVDGTLAPGERLNDAELVSWLGVSRTPIREALARLELSGLVQTRPGRFTMVSPVDSREARGAQSVVAAMHELAVREAVPLLGEPELDAMRTWNARFRDALRENRVDDALAADLGCRGHARTGRPRGGPVARRAGAGRHAHVERPVPGRAAGEPGGRRAGRRSRLSRPCTNWPSARRSRCSASRSWTPCARGTPGSGTRCGRTGWTTRWPPTTPSTRSRWTPAPTR